MSDIMFIYDVLNNNIECHELLNKIGICMHNYPIRNSILLSLIFFLKKR